MSTCHPHAAHALEAGMVRELGIAIVPETVFALADEVIE
jgi:hypothetical protein